MNLPVFTLSTGKVVSLDKGKFDLIGNNKLYHLVFDDESDLFLTIPEYKELLARQRSWRNAGAYNGNYVDSEFKV